MRSNADITRAVEAHSDTVLRVCSVYFGGRPEREDAFQETFLKYARSQTEFNDEEHRKAWLIRVATNVCKDMLKKAESKAVLLEELDEATQPQWDQGVETSDRAEELTAALRELDERYRVVLYLKYYEGYTAAEISKMLDIPENTVYTNLTRGREKLKEVLSRG